METYNEKKLAETPEKDVTDEEMEERLKKRDKGELAKEEIKAHE